MREREKEETIERDRKNISEVGNVSEHMTFLGTRI